MNEAEINIETGYTTTADIRQKEPLTEEEQKQIEDYFREKFGGTEFIECKK